MPINEKATVEVQVNGEQAKNELRNLESYANSLKGRLAEAYAAGDTKKIKTLEKELSQTNKQLKTMRTATKNIDVAMQNLSTAGPKELRNLIRDINAKLNSPYIKRGSSEWNKYQQQLKLVQAEQRKVNAELRESQSWLTRFNNGFTKWAALGASAIATITGVSMALSKMRTDRNAKESSAANVKALTGLGDNEIKWLTRQAEILSTTMEKSGLRVKQSSSEILEAYMLVGSAKPELLENKEALNAVTIEALRLSRAANIELKEAVDGVTLSMNQYGAGVDQAAKYTNIMAAGSKVGAAAVTSITTAVKKAGITASGADVSMEQLVGTIETLAEKGIKDEVAGTGLRMFFLRLQTGADETNPKVVGLQTALQNLKKLTTQGIVDRFGTETYSVAKALIDGAERVEYFTNAVTNTNIAVEQAAINSATAEVKMAQYKNKIKEAGIELMERLNPSLSALMWWSTKLIQVMPAIIDWLKKYGGVVVYLVAVIASYSIAMKLQWFWLNKVKTETGHYIAIQKIKAFWDKAVTASTWLYIAATSALTGKTKQAGLAMKAFFMIIKANPFGAVATVITAVVGAVYLLSKRTNEARRQQLLLNSVMNDAQASISGEKTELEALFKVANNEKIAKEKRLEAIKKLNEVSPEYLESLNLETIGTDKARQALDKYIASMITMAELESAKTRLTDTDTQLSELKNKQAQYLSERDSFWGALKKVPKNVLWLATGGIAENAGESYVNDIEELNKQRQQLIDLISEKTTNIYNQNTSSSSNPCIKCGNSPCTCIPDAKGNNDALTAEERRYQEELQLLKKAYLDNSILTKEEYNRLLEDIEMQHLNRQLEIAGVEAEERMKIQQKILDAQIKFKQQCLDEDRKAEEERKKNETKAQDESYKALERKYQLEIQAATLHHYQTKSTESDFLKTLSGLQDSFYQSVLSSTSISEEQKLQIKKMSDDKQIDQAKESYDTYKDQLAGTFNTLSDVAQSFGSEFASFLSDTDKSLGDFAKSVIGLALDTLQKIMVAAIAERTIKNIATLGFVGVAKAAGEIALITAAFQGAKALIGNFYTGGFTSPGEWDKPQGIVHSNEFVANRFAVGNPAVMPVLKLIDTAQKNNTVGTLTSRDISNALGYSNSMVNKESVQVVQTSDPAVKVLISECTSVMKSMKERLSEPFYTINTVTGRNGIKQSLDKYNQMINNKSRKS